MTEPSGAPPEKRVAPRQVTFLKGSIMRSDGSVLEHVSVENLSAVGARLKVASGWALPDEMTLDIPARQERRTCQVRWRLSGAVGVLFRDRARPVPRSGEADIAARLIELEAEIRQLQRENEHLRDRLRRGGAASSTGSGALRH
jgi:hypothetical protein